MLQRPRRLRTSANIRNLVAETQIRTNGLMYPMFITHSEEGKEEIPSMPGIFRLGQKEALLEVETCLKAGLRYFLLFGVSDGKSEDAHHAWMPNGAVQRALITLKKQFGNEIFLCTDVCLCAYTTHGHCGIVHNHTILNDESHAALSKMALSHAEAGADMVSPSDMMDGRVEAIRNTLDHQGFVHTPIMSYSIKYASSYYGPFRDAAASTPDHGDRKTYQMDYRNRLEANREANLDIAEGADILMVKPALAYLDIIRQLKNATNLPVACYNVSGEYSMVKAAAAKGWLDEAALVRENFSAFTRAGADIIISYHAKDFVTKGWNNLSF